MSAAQDLEPGIVRVRSHHSVAATMDRLETLLKERGVLIFNRIDFAADAARAGLEMRPQQVMIFGNPKAGTPLLQLAPTAGLDLPARALAWQEVDGGVWVAYNAPDYIVKRHGLSPFLAANLAVLSPLIERAAAGEIQSRV